MKLYFISITWAFITLLSCSDTKTEMEKVDFFVTPGYGERQLKMHGYSQAVKIGNRIETSGQGGCELLGKTAIVELPGVKLNVHYIDENNLHRKTDTNEAYETISYAKLSENIHFLNWIEKDGLTVSHIVDCKSNTVQSFLSWQDAESGRGARSGILRSITIKFNE